MVDFFHFDLPLQLNVRRVMFFPVKINKLKIMLKILPPVGIIGGCIATIQNGSIFFGSVTALYILTYVVSIISDKQKKERISKDPRNSVNSDNLTFKGDDLQRYLDISIRDKMQIIPVLAEQLQSVINQTDEAAGGLTEAFIGINRQAKKQLQAVQGVFGNLSEQSSGDNIFSQTKKNLQELQTNFLTLTTFFDKSILMISEVLEQLKKIDSFALNITKIGKTTNILALNASIEAAKSGDAGSGFKVIASEINALSKNSSESIKEIAEINIDLTSKVNELKQEIQQVQAESRSIGIRTDELFVMTNNKIGGMLQETAEKMKNVADDAAVLSKEISKVVVSIQFQDITRQRIEHVISPLNKLYSDISEAINNLLNNNNLNIESTVSQTTDSLMDQYTMESEREILKKYNNQGTK